jgi:hypothetical protein
MHPWQTFSGNLEPAESSLRTDPYDSSRLQISDVRSRLEPDEAEEDPKARDIAFILLSHVQRPLRSPTKMRTVVGAIIPGTIQKPLYIISENRLYLNFPQRKWRHVIQIIRQWQLY